MIGLLRGQALFPTFTDTDITAGLVYEHMTVKPMVIQNLMKGTLCKSSQKVKTSKKYVIHCNPLRCGWMAVKILDVTLQHPGRYQWGTDYIGWGEKKSCQ